MNLTNASRHISHGFYQVSEHVARLLVKPYPARLTGKPSHGWAMRMRKLPIGGYEKKIEHEGRTYWLARTPHGGRQVWSVRLEGPA
jgi:hypothetical protein